MKKRILHIDSTDSTNSYIKQVASDGNELLVVAAESQSDGRGCGTNKWESETGKNLTFSIRYTPKGIPAQQQFVISMQTAVAIHRAMGDFGIETSVKWPNDIYVGDRKLCGILIENRLFESIICETVIGIGLNVNQQKFVSDAPNPVSMRQILQRDCDKEDVLKRIIWHFTNIEDNILPVYKSLLYRKTGYHGYRDDKGFFEAEIADVAPNGMLTLRDRQGKTRQYAFKEVAFCI